LDLTTQIRELVNNLNGNMAPSPYDIAWMARIPNQHQDGARWPELINWLIENQWLDGSWGGTIRYYHDRILCTLAAIIALKQHGPKHVGAIAEEAIERGERYIWHNLHRLLHDPFELVGFELILPNLLMEALALGLDVPKHTCGYGAIRREKLSLIPPEMLYSPKISTVHSLEFLGKDGSPEKMEKALSPNGSLGNSPATTSYYILQGGKNERAFEYLEMILNHREHVIYLYPCDTFELTWVLHSLSFCDDALVEWVDEKHWDTLEAQISERGIGLDPSFGIEDGDITSVTTRLLKLAGRPVSTSILARFQDPEKHIFRTYDYERNPSIGTNIHALEAITVYPDYPNREEITDRVLAFLLANRVFDTYWVDKWHASPYYATAHVLIGILKAAPHIVDECKRTIEWIMHTQREDGSWGFFEKGTVEETAYAMTALLRSKGHFDIDREQLRRGASFLYREMSYGGLEALSVDNSYSYPPLWIGKPLYVPKDIVRASILAALRLCEEHIGPM